jgi:peptidoglycan hydrolase-like protein with peptidoglycan-binding domain
MPTRPAIKPPPLARVLSHGMRGEDVRTVQTILQREGFFNGTPLGNFLDMTEEAVKTFQGQHIDEGGKELTADGIVGGKTWWALHNPNGDAQRNFIPPEKAQTADTGPRTKFLAYLYGLHKTGVREIPDGSNYGDGVTQIVNDCGFSYGIAWCLALLSSAFKRTTGQPPLGAMHVGCSLFWNEALKHGVAFPKASKYVPIPGDIAIYNYGSGLLSNGRLSGAGHAAAMARLSLNGAQFNALEGNVGNRLKHSVRNVSEKSFIGWINPFGDKNNPPKFERGITQAPVIAADYSTTR